MLAALIGFVVVGGSFVAFIWRIDVGMAAHYGGPVQVLLIEGDHVEPLSLEGAAQQGPAQ